MSVHILGFQRRPLVLIVGRFACQATAVVVQFLGKFLRGFALRLHLLLFRAWVLLCGDEASVKTLAKRQWVVGLVVVVVDWTEGTVFGRVGKRLTE